jgi:hypothetical protein
MKKPCLVRNLCAGIVLMLAFSVSQAQTIAINPISASASTGGTVSFSIEGSNFEMVDGAFDLSWDASVLTYNGDFTFDAGLTPRDTPFDTIDFLTPGLLTVGWTTGFGPALVFGSTPRAIGSLSFTMIGGPGSSSTLTIGDSASSVPFTDASFNPILMDYVGSAAANPVPVPAAVWLFGSGLFGLLGVARSKKAA